VDNCQEFVQFPPIARHGLCGGWDGRILVVVGNGMVVRGRGRQKGFVRGLREGGAPGWQRGSGRPPLCQGTPRRGRKWGQTFFGLTSEWRGGMGFGFGLQFEKRVGRGVCSSFSIATEFPFPSYILKYAALKTTRAMAKFCSPMFLVYFSSVLFYTFFERGANLRKKYY